MISEFRYGALLAYSPRGQSEVSRKSRDVCYRIKNADPATLAHLTLRVHEHVQRPDILTDFFGADVTLVPMPRSAPLVPGALWPAEKICRALLDQGLGSQLVPALERIEAVPKSSRSAPGERPSASRHYDSFRAEPRVDVGGRILLVDDVVTKGATAIAAVSRLVETYPNAEIALFAAIRTKGLVAEIEQILDPVVGVVRFVDEQAHRDP